MEKPNLNIDLDKNYNLLAASIIKQAIIDYQKLRDNEKVSNATIGSIRKFFYSEYFTALSKSDGPAIFKQIEKNYDEYGSCMPFNSTWE